MVKQSYSIVKGGLSLRKLYSLRLSPWPGSSTGSIVRGGLSLRKLNSLRLSPQPGSATGMIQAGVPT